MGYCLRAASIFRVKKWLVLLVKLIINLADNIISRIFQLVIINGVYTFPLNELKITIALAIILGVVTYYFIQNYSLEWYWLLILLYGGLIALSIILVLISSIYHNCQEKYQKYRKMKARRKMFKQHLRKK